MRVSRGRIANKVSALFRVDRIPCYSPLFIMRGVSNEMMIVLNECGV